MPLRPILWLALLLACAGCSQRTAFGGCAYRLQSGECQAGAARKISDADLLEATASAVDALLQTPGLALPRESRLGVTTLADLDNLESSAGLGRVLGEQVAARLTRHGYAVSEIRQRPTLLFNPQGEFILSRDAHQVFAEHTFPLVCVGTYRAAADTVYVTLKLLRLEDGVALAAHAFSLPLGPNLAALLRE